MSSVAYDANRCHHDESHQDLIKLDQGRRRDKMDGLLGSQSTLALYKS
jgi:hypothetical protein